MGTPLVLVPFVAAAVSPKVNATSLFVVFCQFQTMFQSAFAIPAWSAAAAVIASSEAPPVPQAAAATASDKPSAADWIQREPVKLVAFVPP